MCLAVIVLTAAVLSCVPAVWAAPNTWWVSSVGLPSADCTQPSPCARIQTAVDCARDGDTINILAGSYDCESGSGAGSGVSVNKTLVFVAHGVVDIDCHYAGRAFWFVNVSVALSGITIRNANTSDAAVFVQLTAPSTGSHRHQFLDCAFADNTGTLILIDC